MNEVFFALSDCVPEKPTGITAKVLAEKLGLDALRVVVRNTGSADMLLGVPQPVTVDGETILVPFDTISRAVMICRGWDKPAKRIRRSAR